MVISPKMRFCSLFLFSAIASFTFLSNPLYAQSKKITYLPRNENLDGTDKLYGEGEKILREVSCPAAADLFKEAQKCSYCLETLKPNCPDCCLVFRPKRAIRCTPDHDPRYDCKPAAFSITSCPQVQRSDADQTLMENCSQLTDIPSVQARGCPSTKPNGNCTPDQNGDWICDTDNLGPESRGCPSDYNIGAECNAPYYSIASSSCPDEGSDAKKEQAKKSGSCYKYTPTQDFLDCVNQYHNPCKDYADDQERCTKGVFCCKKKLCNTGYNCDNDYCRERIGFTACDNYSNESCAEIQKEAVECLISGTCSDCFTEVDSGLNYQFVARSSDAITIIWQLTTELKSTGFHPPTYFFTKVKVFARGDQRPIHESTIHQKNLEAAFAIYNATNIPKGVLVQGKPYIVRLYYFLPQSVQIPGIAPRQEVKVEVKNAQLTVIRTRE